MSDAFYAPMPDGRRFINVETGEVHTCFDSCDRRTEAGDRIVCPLTHVVLGLATCVRPVPKKRMRDQTDTLDARLERERKSRRRIGHAVVDSVFKDTNVSDEQRVRCVDLAMRIHDWLGEKIPFDAMTYATIMCMAEGVSTKTMTVARHPEFARHLKPLRYVGKLGIRQNAVTRAYTAMMKKQGDALVMD